MMELSQSDDFVPAFLNQAFFPITSSLVKIPFAGV
jgi:hypothetical protein